MPELLEDEKFFEGLFIEDAKEGEKVHAAGCPHCGGKLHQAHFPRKVRGIGEAASQWFQRRFSYCCSRCRRRQTPASLRFLGRKVYAGAAVLVAAIMALSGSLAEAMRLVGAAQRTVRRFRRWFGEKLLATDFWKGSSGTLGLPPEPRRMPLSLLERFVADDDAERLLLGLRFLSPLSASADCSPIRF